MRNAATIVLGLVCGVALSWLRLAPGGDWLTGPIVPANDAAIVRALALAFVAIAVAPFAVPASLTFLWSFAAGLAAHGLLIGETVSPPMWGLLALGAALGLATGILKREEGPDPVERATWGERIGLFVAGGGAGLALEAIARHVRLLGGGLRQDDALFGATFAVLVALGASLFGWIALLPAARRLAFPVGLAGAAACTFVSLSVLERLSDKRTFDRFLGNFSLDASWHATLAAGALIAAAVLITPAFALGAGLRGAHGRGSLSSALLGAAAALVLVPQLLRRDVASSMEAELFSAQLLPFALLAAVMGACLAALSVKQHSGKQLSARARWTAAALCVPLAAPVVLVEVKPLFLFSPWERHLVLPFVAFETAEGLATVEPGDGGLKIATIDRVELTPGLDGASADREQLRASFACLAPDVRARGRENNGVRVLLVGQLTAPRAAWLAELGATRIDRTAAWHVAMPELEKALFEGAPLPAGEVLAPAKAAEALASGAYDLAVVPAAGGDAPEWRTLEAPAGTVIVRWSALEAPQARRLCGSRFAGADEREPRYLLAAGGLLRPALGTFDGATRAADDAPGRAEIVHLEAGPERPTPLARLQRRKLFRADEHRLRAARALAAEPAPAADERALFAGYAAFCDLQVASSPFETAAEQVELDPRCLELLREAALAKPPSLFVRSAWNWLARVLMGKRDVEALYDFVAPIAARHAPWPELEIALARADLEALDPQAAVERLQAVRARGAGSAEVSAALADALEAAGDARAAIPVWREANAQRPWDRGVRRRLAQALVRAGDPEGRSQIEQLLAEEPSDEELRPFLEPGPWPAPARGFQPEPGPR